MYAISIHLLTISGQIQITKGKYYIPTWHTVYDKININTLGIYAEGIKIDICLTCLQK